MNHSERNEERTVPELKASDSIKPIDSDESVALIDGARLVSYDEFTCRTSALARELVAAGVGPDVAVAVQIDRSVEMMVAIHAIVLAGGHYVPLGSDMPADRIDYMLETSGARLTLVGPASAESDGTLRIDCSGPVAEVAPFTAAERRSPLHGDSPAYTLFTSGSTGRPKGVTVSHSAIVNRLAWMRDLYQLTESDVFLQKTPITFDVSVWELFLPAAIGAPLVLVEPGRHGDPGHLSELIVEHAVTAVHFVPSMLAAFSDVLGDDLVRLDSLRRVFTSGEALTAAVAGPVLRSLPTAELHNLYGPTEAAVDVTAHHVTFDDAVVPIGRPVPATTTYILDAALQQVPAGVPGELYLGGVQLARGYAARPDLTAERFVADPFGPAGGRLYRTGDLVRWTPSGAIDYLGRTDFQVKLRGQRLELGEVEAAIAAAPGVVHAAAAVVDGPAGQQLAGYVAPASVDLDVVEKSIAQALPPYMRPSAWVALDEMPLSSAGKVDRRALPEPRAEAAEYIAPSTDSESIVAALYGDLLGVDTVGVTDGFFDLGGNSLAATRLAARVSDALGVEVTVRDVFDSPSVRELVEAVTGRAHALPEVTAVSPRPTTVPLSFAQQRMWFINRLDPESTTYAIPVLLRLSGPVDVDALQRALVDVVGRHEVLRTTIGSVDGDPVQVIHPVESIPGMLDIATVAGQDELEAVLGTGWDLARELPLRVRVLRTGPDEVVLAIIVHHIAADGESMGPLLRDVFGAYAARVEGTEPSFPPLTVQFADYAIWQHNVLGDVDDPDSVVGRQLTKWTTALAGLPDVLALPADRPRRQVATGRVDSVAFDLPAGVTRALVDTAAASKATPFMVLHAALAVLLARLSGTDDIAVATPIAGRGQSDLDPLVGMFVNTLVLRTTVAPSSTFEEFLAHVRSVDLDAFAASDVPFEALVEALNPTRSESFAPLAQVMLSVAPDAPSAVDMQVGDVAVSPIEGTIESNDYDLLVGVRTAEPGQSWSCALLFAVDLFDPSTAETIASRFVALLTELVSPGDTVIGDARLLTASQEAGEAAVEWGEAADLPAVTTVPAGVAAQIDRTPDVTALIAGDREVTYGEFGTRIARLARVLADSGVGRGSAVAVCIPRSVEMMVAVHATMAVGAQYVPIDLSAPADRAEYMLTTSGAHALLVGGSDIACDVTDVARGAHLPVIVVDENDVVDASAGALHDVVSAGPVLSGADAAYTLFTSGSTGRPKGVTLTHDAVLNRLWWGLDELPITVGDRVIQKTPYTFDCSVPELFAPFLRGATLVVLRDGGHLDPLYVASEVARTRATMIHFVPSMLSVFLEIVGEQRLAELDSVRIVSTTGEALPPALAAQTRSVWPDAQFYNLYGPTEAAVEITAFSIGSMRGDEHTVSIGRPIWNSSAVILDSRLRRVPVGVPGELYLGGVQLARGYAARADLTAERFVADPHGAPGERLYRTGDLVRRMADGGIEYLGRTDFQVKLRGQRIELGEIESVLAGVPGVVHAAATVSKAAGGDEHLVGYLAGTPGDSIDLDAVKAEAARALPVYMVPTVWMVVDDIALNTAGKIDRKALPAPDFGTAEIVEPETDAERSGCAVFADVLGIERVSVTESFFDAGGNSLSAMRLVARLSTAWGVELTVRDLFDAPTVRGLAASIGERAAALPPITAVEVRPERVPLSFAQQRMWFINRLEPDSGTYNIPFALRLTGRLDVAALRAAVCDVVEHHEVLRTTFPDVDGTPYQAVGSPDLISEQLDWAEVDSPADIEASATAGFDLVHRPPMRTRLLASGPDEHVIAIVLHHIAADGESMGPFVADLVAAYTARAAGDAPTITPLDFQFADFAIWQHQVLGGNRDGGSVVDRQLDYWTSTLASMPGVVDLPTDRPRPSVASGAGETSDFVIDEATAARVVEVARQTGATPFMVLHAALAVLLARLSGTDDIAVATPVAGRGQGGLERLVGMFVNTLVLRTHVDGSMTFGELLAEAREVDLAAFAHADVPFEQVVDAVNPTRSEAFAPLAQVMLSFDPGASVSESSLDLGDLTVSGVPLPSPPAQVDLQFVISPSDTGNWNGLVVFATDLFDAGSIATTTARFTSLLTGLLSDPGRPVGDVELLSDAEKAAVIATHDGPPPILPTISSISSALSARAAAAPASTALIVGERTVSYGEFAGRVARLAGEIVEAGVDRESAVAVCIPRSVEMMVAVHAVVAAGAQFVPIDLSAPTDRAEYMLSTAGAVMLLVSDTDRVHDVVTAAVDAGVRVKTLDESGPVAGTPADLAELVRTRPVRGDGAVYTLFTSGSTGRPKGVTLTHDAVVNRLWWGVDELPIDTTDVIVQKTPYTFDCSVPELFAPLMVGATLVVLRDGGHLDPGYVADEIARTRATMVHFVPSMLSVFLDVVGHERARSLDSVRILSTTGEALPPAVAAATRRAWPTALFYNLYGPTEAAVEITAYAIGEVGADDPTVPIGTPIWNSSALVLDDRLRIVPAGVPGELYLGGIQLARGYAARSDLTAERFVADPYGDSGARMYRTGDLVRRMPDGGIEYLGRTDFQVKLRGQRIELGEIESVLAAAPGVVHAAATVAAAPGGGEHLVGYVSGGPGEQIDVDAVKAEAHRALPGYMVPTVWMVLDDIALNTAGKIDRKALPAPEFGTTEQVVPATRAERAVADAFADVLGVDSVGVTDDFFDVGGNSLSAMRLVARVSEALDVEVTIRDLFDAPSVREIIAATAGRAPALPPVTAVTPRPNVIPLSFAQQRMWFLNRFEPGAGTYNIPAVLRLSGALDAVALRHALDDVVVRHEVLRTTFPDVDGAPRQVIAPADTVATRLDWQMVESRDEVISAVGDGFDLANQWPLRARLWRVGPDEHVFALVAHHIAADGESMAPLVSDLVSAYESRVAGRLPEFAPLPVQFADFAIWQHEALGAVDDDGSVVARQLRHWVKTLAGSPDAIDLPTDRPRPPVASGRGSSVSTLIPSDVAHRVRAVASTAGATEFMVLHASLAALLSRLSAADDVVISTAVAGRGQEALERLVGMFVNTLALRAAVRPGMTFGELLAQVRDVDATAFANSDVPFESVVDAVDPVRSEAFAPLAQVSLEFTRALPTDGGDGVDTGTLRVAPYDQLDVSARLDLHFAVEATDAEWRLKVEYATDLFDADTVESFADSLVRLLSEFTASPDTARVGVADLVSPEQTAVLTAPATPAVQPRPLGELWDAHGADEPGDLIIGDQSMSRDEFDAATNRLARELLSRGLGPGDLVAILMRRSIHAVLAVVAVSKAGAAFVNIDPTQPVQRRDEILADSGAVFGLTVTGTPDLPDSVEWLAVDNTVADHSAQPIRRDELTRAVHADDLAYLIYTSGSTGKPKAAALSHRGLANLVDGQRRILHLGPATRMLHVASPTFDASIFELVALCTGSGIVISPADVYGGDELAEVLAEGGVTHAVITPSTMDGLDPEQVPELSTLASVGEACPPDLRNRWVRAGRTFFNLYGPTESTIWGTGTEPSTIDGPIHIGGPLPGLGALVLGDGLRPVPVGVPGELYLTGDPLALGYLGRPDLSATRFVADPFGPAGTRMYRTGDRVVRTVSGDLEYLGRVDFQVKLRGQRIELGEIESVLSHAPGVRSVAVVVATAPSGGEVLVGYLSGDDLDRAELADYASRRLVAYMRPTVWMLVDEMPLTVAGKVDRRGLPSPEFGAVDHVEPIGPAETAVAAVFADVLGTGHVSVTESFFDAGGNSLSAMRVVSRVSDALGVEVGVRDLFDAPTVRTLVHRVAGRAPALPPVTRAQPRPDRIPLSFAQQRMWFINNFEPASATYNLPVVMRITGPLDADALRTALGDVVRRHEVLRTTFPTDDGVPYQDVAPADAVDGRLDWGHVDSDSGISSAVTDGFDLAVDWPIRGRLLTVDASTHVFALVAHHIAADGESLQPLIGDIVTAYLARSSGREPEFTPLDVQFADFAIWQREVLGEPDDPTSIVGRQVGYWSDALAGTPDVLEIPTDRPRPQAASGRGGVADFEIPREVGERIVSVASERGATPFMVLDAALAVLLARLSASDDVAIASPIAGRGRRELDAVVGMFVNTIVLRSRVDLGESFDGLLARTRADVLNAFANADVPFETVVEAVNPVRSEAFSPLAQVMLSLDPGASATDMDLPAGDIVISAIRPVDPPAQVDMTITVSSTTDGPWHGSITYATDLFDASTVVAFGERLAGLLGALTADTDGPVGDAALLTDAEISESTRLERGVQRQLPAEDLASALAAAAAAHPHREALLFRDRSVAYAELGARVNTLARELITAGVGPDVAVAVCIPRSVELIVAIHAVVAAGGQYVPVDTSAPADRVEYMMSTAGARIALVHAGLPTPAPIAGAGDGVTVIEVDSESAVDESVAPVVDADRRAPLLPQHAAYTIFTSGSTGRPKGVTLPHDAVVNRLRWGLDELPIDGDDLVVLKTPYTFDCSVAELFAPLMEGSRLLIAEPDGHLDPAYMADLIADAGATMVHFVPSMLSVFLELAGPERLARLDKVRIISTTGEALPPSVAAQTRAEVPGAVLYNLYGPTEAAVEITYQQLDTIGDVVPIGVPVWNSSAYVLDGRLNQVAAGVPGELYVAGVQLARGYAARPDLTADRFLADPFGPAGSRMYRTGDLVRRNHAGELEYLGRTDFQVKLRGQRIELGEIEAAVAQAPGVVHASVTVAQAPDGGEHLVAYVAGVPGDVLDVDGVRHAIAADLPEYMRPTVWMPLDEIPLNSAGKLDRKALPAPEFTAGEYVAPVGADEAAVAAAFADVLGVDRIGVTDSFFDLGGNSLSAMRLAARAGDALGSEVSVRDVFEAPTVRELVELVGSAKPALAPIVAVSDRPERIPLSFAQQRMWFINRFDPSSGVYNIPAVLTLTGPLDVDAMQAAFIDVLERHEVLRTLFVEHDGSPSQAILDVSDAAERFDWAMSDVDGVTEAVTSGFHLATQLPIRVRLAATGPGEHVLAIVVHHIAADGQSMGPMVRDVVTAYLARRDGRVPDFPPLPVQFADFALWQHSVLGAADDPESVLGRQAAYWRDRLGGVPDVIELPTDRPRPPRASMRGQTIEFTVPGSVGERIGRLAAQHGATPFMVVHAALSVLLARLSSSDDVVVGTPIAGRGQRVLDPLVGMFVNSLALRSTVHSGATFAELLGDVRSGDLDAFANADIPFETLVDVLNPTRSEAFAPLSQVWLSVDEADEGPGDVMVEPGGLSVEPAGDLQQPARVDLNVALGSRAGGADWSGTVTYATDLFNADTVEQVAAALVDILDVVTADPSAVVGDLSVLTEEDERRVGSWAHSAAPLPSREARGVLHEVVPPQARTSTLLVAGGRTVAGAELMDRVTVLARRLIDAGVGPDVAVAVCIPRSIEMFVALHAVMTAGGFYVPIVVDGPADRARYVIETAGAEILLVNDLLGPPEWAVADGISVIGVDTRAPVIGNVTPVGDADRRAPLRPDDAAYTIFTSGSTGRPKGVTVSHRSMMSVLATDVVDGRFGPDDVFLMVIDYTFDPSVLDLFRGPICGGLTVVTDPADQRDPWALQRHVVDHRVSVMMLVPSMLSLMVSELTADELAGMNSVRIVHTGGEAVTPALSDAICASWPDAEGHNRYGPTENTVYCTLSLIAAGRSVVPIGRPTAYSIARVLDSRLHQVPVGVAGELYMGGDQVARGYIGRYGLTAERFVADPYGEPGQRLYRTGDLVRWNHDGELEYLGRTDFQVKLRGQRIELGEIEAVLGSAPGVRQAAAVVTSAPSGGQVLVAYVEGHELSEAALVDYAAQNLLEYMRPTSWMIVDALPLSTAGKIDRRNLPEPVFRTAEYVTPVGPLEEAVAKVYADLLDVATVSATTSFFDLGGNSLSAARVVARLRDEHGVSVELAWLFEDATVRGLAARVEGAESGGTAVLIPLRADGSRAPLFCVHPAGGLAWFFGGLVPYLDDRPLYGLQDPHVVAGEESAPDVASLAARYVSEIREVQPEGPYNVLGWSIGGTLAYEMACQLEAAGHDVGYLGVMDASLTVEQSSEPDSTPDTAETVGDLLGSWRDLFDLGDDVQAASADEVAAIVRDQIASMGLLDSDQVERIMDSFASAGDILNGYRPGRYSGDVHFFTATEDKPDPVTFRAAWGDHVDGEVHNVDVPTHHLGMADAQALAIIGPAVNDALLPRRTVARTDDSD